MVTAFCSLRWNKTVKIYLKEIGRKAMDRIDLAQDRDKWRGVLNAWTFGLHKMRGIWMDEELPGSYEELWSLGWVDWMANASW